MAGGFGHIETGFGKAGTLELNRGVCDVKFAGESVVDAGENFFAFLHVHVGDAHVAGEGVEISAECPYMDIVDFLNAFDAEKSGGDFFQLNFPGQAFQKNVCGFAENSCAGPEDHNADADTDDWIDPVSAAPANRKSATDDRDVGKSIAEIVNPDGADIQIAAAAVDGERDAAVDDQREQGDPEHPVRLNFDGIAEAIHRFVNYKDGNESENDGVYEGGQNSGAMIAVRFFGCGRAKRPARGEPGNHHGGDVRQVMHGIADEGHGIACVAGDKLDENEEESGGHGAAENDGHALRRGVDVGVRMRMTGMAVRVVVHAEILLAAAAQRTAVCAKKPWRGTRKEREGTSCCKPN
jgi:hypothetical protein